MTLSSWVPSTRETRVVLNVVQFWQGLRRTWAAHRTLIAVSDLTQAQLRDIGLLSSDPLQELDEHQRYWRDRLSPWMGHRF